MQYKLKTGVSFIDQALGGGLPSADISCLSTPDDRTGNLILGHYLAESLNSGESAVLITFENVKNIVENFKSEHFTFENAFRTGKLIILNYQPNIRHKVNFLQNYNQLVDEISMLCDKHLPHRIAIHGVDALLNLSNVQMAHISAEKLGCACKSKLSETGSVLAQFVNYQDKTHQLLATALEKISASSLSLRQVHTTHGNSQFEFSIRKAPWFNYDSHPLKMLESDLLMALGVTITKANGALGVAS